MALFSKKTLSLMLNQSDFGHITYKKDKHLFFLWESMVYRSPEYD